MFLFDAIAFMNLSWTKFICSCSSSCSDSVNGLNMLPASLYSPAFIPSYSMPYFSASFAML